RGGRGGGKGRAAPPGAVHRPGPGRAGFGGRRRSRGGAVGGRILAAAAVGLFGLRVQVGRGAAVQTGFVAGPRWCNVTVAQGMEGDGKKEDLTVLLRTSTHRTQKVRSSMEIVQRLRQRYLQFLQVVVDVLTDEVSYRDFEDRLRQELDALGRDIVKWVVESCDERLREE